MTRPFIDLHVLRDGTTDLTLYGDDDQPITDPSPELMAFTLRRIDLAVERYRAVMGQ